MSRKSLALVNGVSATLKLQPCYAEHNIVILNEVKNLVALAAETLRCAQGEKRGSARPYAALSMTGGETAGVTSEGMKSQIQWYNVNVNSILNEENNYEHHRGNPHRA